MLSEDRELEGKLAITCVGHRDCEVSGDRLWRLPAVRELG